MVQNHIHMGLTLGTAPENAPIYKWATTDRLEINQLYGAMRVAVDGTRRIHVLKSGGVPMRWEDKRYILKIVADGQYSLEQRIAQIKAMMKQPVFVVDHMHCADNEDHTAYVVPMWCEDVSEFKVFEPKLSRFYVQVSLKDLRDGDQS